MRIYKKALLIGINYKNTDLELNGCINDCKNLKNLLLSRKIFKKKHIRMMTDYKKGLLYPTKQNILTQIDELVKFANRNKHKKVRLFLSYSGHGHYIPDINGDESDGNDEVLCPIDCIENNYIIDDEIKSRLIDRLHENVELIILVDACHSGTMGDLKFNYELNKNKNKNKIKILDTQKPTKCKCILISGCRDDQVSMDAYLKKYKNNKNNKKNNYEFQGAMTNSFIKNYNQNINIKRLLNKMRRYLKKNKFEQVPQLSSSKRLNILSKLF